MARTAAAQEPASAGGGGKVGDTDLDLFSVAQQEGDPVEQHEPFRSWPGTTRVLFRQLDVKALFEKAYLAAEHVQRGRDVPELQNGGYAVRREVKVMCALE